MAKRKTPKADKIVDLKPKAEKITDEQLKNVQTTIRTVDQLTMELGRIDIRKYGILKGIENIQAELDLLRQELKKEYDTDDIDIQTGIINYPSENGEADKKN